MKLFALLNCEHKSEIFLWIQIQKFCLSFYQIYEMVKNEKILQDQNQDLHMLIKMTNLTLEPSKRRNDKLNKILKEADKKIFKLEHLVPRSHSFTWRFVIFLCHESQPFFFRKYHHQLWFRWTTLCFYTWSTSLKYWCCSSGMTCTWTL